MKSNIIKKESKALLRGRHGKALLIVLFSIIFCAVITGICFAVIYFSNTFSQFGTAVSIASAAILIFLSLIALCIYSSSSLGEKAWYSGITANKKNCSKRLFFWFRPKNSFKALSFRTLLFFIKCVWAILFLLPCAILLWSVYYLAGSGGIEFYLFASMLGGSVLFAVCGIIFYFITVQRYFIAEYLFASNPRLSPLTAIKQSKNLLDGHITEIVKFKLSFIPWFLSCLLIVPAFYFIPYYKESCCMVAKRITL